MPTGPTLSYAHPPLHVPRGPILRRRPLVIRRPSQNPLPDPPMPGENNRWGRRHSRPPLEKPPSPHPPQETNPPKTYNTVEGWTTYRRMEAPLRPPSSRKTRNICGTLSHHNMHHNVRRYTRGHEIAHHPSPPSQPPPKPSSKSHTQPGIPPPPGHGPQQNTQHMTHPNTHQDHRPTPHPHRARHQSKMGLQAHIALRRISIPTHRRP